MEIQKNIYIQLFDDESRILSERLIKQDPEMNLGPKEVHNGPMRISFTFLEKQDIDRVKMYLDKLSGSLPLGTTAKGKVSKAFAGPQLEDRHEQVLIDALKVGKDEDQDIMIKYLRELGYIFVTSEYLQMILPDTYEVKKVYLDKYQWLIKRIKESKTNPSLDKFDPKLLFGIQIMSERSERVITILNGDFKAKEKISLPDNKPMTVKGTNLIKYPQYMTEDERLKFGQEHRGLFNNPEKKPSKFYLRWYKDVTVGNELRIDIKARLKDEKA